MTALAAWLTATALLASAPAPVPVVAQASTEETITLNLKDADIVEVIALVSEVTGRNFIIDPRVRARVTVISAEPLTTDALYDTFLSVLAVNGFAAVPAGDVIKIVPEVNARHGGDMQPAAAVPGEEIITQVIPVHNVPVAQMVGVLRPLVPQFGHIAAFPPSNMLIVSDRAENVERLMDIVRRIDLASDYEIEVVRLEHASALDAVRLLTALTQAQSRGGEPRRHPERLRRGRGRGRT